MKLKRTRHSEQGSILVPGLVLAAGLAILTASILFMVLVSLEPDSQRSVTTAAGITLAIGLPIGGFLIALGLFMAGKQPSQPKRRPAKQPKPEAERKPIPKPLLRTGEPVKETRASAASLFSTVQAYVDLGMYNHAVQAADELISRFPQSLETVEVGKRVEELRWLAETNVSGPRLSESELEHLVGLTEDDRKRLFNTIKTYIEMEMWKLAVERSEQFVRYFPETEESKVLKKLLPNIRENAKAAESA